MPNPDLKIRDGQTADIAISSAGSLAHKLPQSALTLNNEGRLGVRVVGSDSTHEIGAIAQQDMRIVIELATRTDGAHVARQARQIDGDCQCCHGAWGAGSRGEQREHKELSECLRSGTELELD